MKDRLQELMRLEGLTSAKIAEIAAVQPSAISHILSGRNNPGFDFISNILKTFPNLNARWFLLGEPPIYIEVGTEENIPSQAVAMTPSDNSPQNTYSAPRVVSDLTVENIVQSQAPLKEIARIVFFYDDNSFEVYK